MRLLPNGIKIGNATVIVDIIPKTNPEIRPGGHMNPSHVTDHDTGNAGRGANAEMHNRYIHNMASYDPKDTSHVSWHLTVDEKFIYQHLPFDEPAYHCGDGFGIKSGNRTSIGVEKCMNIDGDRAATEENAIALEVYLLKNVINKTPSNVVPHQIWSGKYCPAIILRRDGSFNPFRKRIQTAFDGAKLSPKPVVSKMHTVKRGDTLSAIAAKYKTTVSKLQKDNNIKNAHFIYPGQVLKVGALKPTTPNKVKPTPKPVTNKAKLKIDGYWGPATTRALQKALGTTQDGIISGQYSNNVTKAIPSVKFGTSGSNVIRALQRKVGAKADGYIGPATVRALQRYLGTPQDGVISKPSMMVKELQRRLNKGKL
ncbi:LysM peptidoglycan-binding domain-containing protein [Oceanobacillus sp. FSL W7-1309]|uniref:LysM peptidoglycan-binding domain-containing protein n=1 Tax=Oceanobacillus sp. FSL W7-1309 TaxID=2954539 RepID=UPI0030F93A97